MRCTLKGGFLPVWESPALFSSPLPLEQIGLGPAAKFFTSAYGRWVPSWLLLGCEQHNPSTGGPCSASLCIRKGLEDNPCVLPGAAGADFAQLAACSHSSQLCIPSFFVPELIYFLSTSDVRYLDF